jgi:hypothetical protein
MTRPPGLAVLGLGFYTPLHAAAVVLLLAAPWAFDAPATAFAAGLALLYLFPPLTARLLLRLGGPQVAVTTAGSGAFLRWWVLCQLQMVFNRLGILEEALRLVPGLYSAWLRLWGARVGRYVFWAPGVLVADRSFVEVGDQACVGAGTKILPHLLGSAAGGAIDLVVAPVVVDAHAIVGGFSVLGPGTRVAAGETTPGCTVLPPFWAWEGGRRVPGSPAAASDPPMPWPALRGTRGHAC